MILMAIAGPEYEYLYADVGSTGRLTMLVFEIEALYCKGYKMNQLSSPMTKNCLTVKLPPMFSSGMNVL